MAETGNYDASIGSPTDPVNLTPEPEKPKTRVEELGRELLLLTPTILILILLALLLLAYLE